MSLKVESAPVTSAVAPEDDYLSRLQRLLDERPEIKWSFNSKDSGSSSLTKVFYTNTVTEFSISSPEDLIAQAAASEERGERRICVIENVSADYVKVLGEDWDVDPRFFADHATNPKKEELWWSKDWKWSQLHSEEHDEDMVVSNTQGAAHPMNFLQNHPGHLDGVFEYHNTVSELNQSEIWQLLDSSNHIHRHCFKDAKWPLQSNTRISYCRPKFGTYLFLVDAPLRLPSDILKIQTRETPTLRFMYSNSRGGVELPRLLPNSQGDCSFYSILEGLKKFCHHSWHLGMLFKAPGRDERFLWRHRKDVLPCHPMIYLLAGCLWEENLRYLDQEIKRISFKEIRNPKLEINSVLHDRREDLAYIKAGLSETAMYIPADVVDFFNEYPIIHSRTRINNWQRLINETTKLEAFLMETFQLFMSSVSVQDSRLSINQAQRGGQITLLALIYVPLSFVTGIFGMNIQQINGSGLNIWVCFVTLVPVVLITVLVFLAVKLHGDRKAARKAFVKSSQV